MYIQAKGGSGVAQFSERFTVEYMYKQSRNEIMLMTTPTDQISYLLLKFIQWKMNSCISIFTLLVHPIGDELLWS